MGPFAWGWESNLLKYQKSQLPPLGTILTPSLLIVIARSEATQQSTPQIAGLPRGACHRAGHLGPDSLARNHRRPSLLSHTSIQLAKTPGLRGDAMTIRRCRDDERDDILSMINTAAAAYRGVIPADCWHEPYMPATSLTANAPPASRSGATRIGAASPA